MLRRLLAWLCHVDWRAPWTTEPRGGGPALDRALDDDELHIEAAERGLTGRDRADWIDRQLDHESALAELAEWERQIRADERRKVIGQENCGLGRPPHKLRVGDYFPDGKVPM